MYIDLNLGIIDEQVRFYQIQGNIIFPSCRVHETLHSLHLLWFRHYYPNFYKAKRQIPISWSWFEITHKSWFYFVKLPVFPTNPDLWPELWLGVAWLPGVVFTVDVLWNQCVLWHSVVILQTAFVWEVVSGDREGSGHSQGLPVHACGKPDRVNFSELTGQEITVHKE